MSITDSTISGNSAHWGGGVYVDAATAHIHHATVTNNIANEDDGGISVNTDGVITLTNSIVAGNIDSDGSYYYPDVSESWGAINSGGYNVIGIDDDRVISDDGAIGDKVGTSGSPLDPRLGPLADNSGRTQTHALLAGSPALDAIPEGGNSYNGSSVTDQRGFPRPQGDNCDVGAYEWEHFIVTAIGPARNAVAAPLDSSVVVTYTQPVSATTVTSRTVAVHSMMQGLITATHSTADSVVTVAPNREFFPGELVYAIATTQTANITGTHPLTATAWQFNAVAPGGHGRFDETPVDFGTGSDDTYAVAWGDYDNDGDLDLAVGNIDGQNAVYPNNGDGSFGSAVNVGPTSDDTASLAWGDFDGDGDLDLAVGNWGEQNAVYPNNGNGTFGSAVNVGPSSDATYSLAWGDFDGDGDLDLAVGNEGEQNAVYLNEPPPPDVSLVKTVSPATAEPGETITYTLTFSNAGGVTATGVVITDSVPVSVTNTSVISSGVAITDTGTSPLYVWDVQDLAQDEGGVITITGVLSDPLAAGTFTNTATIACTETESDDTNNSSDAGLTVSSVPAIVVVKQANATTAEVGETITYTYRVTNTGNVTLNPVSAHDDQLGAVTLGSTSLAPDAGTSGTLTHTVIAGDLPGPLTNTVTVTGTPPVGSDVNATADESVTLSSGAAITVTKRANVSTAEVGETITYTYRVTNTGNVTLNPVSAADDQLGSVTLGATSLAPDAGTSGTLTHTVIAGDLPGPLTNTVTVTGTPPVGSDVTDSDGESVALTSGAAIVVVKQANASTAEVGETITYTYRVTNTGNVTLDPVSAHDDQLGSVTLGATSLAPDAGTSGTLTHTVVEGDLPGPLANTVTVTGTPPVGSDVTDSDGESVALTSGAAIVVVKQANASTAEVGETITYTYRVTNTGNVTLDPVSAHDNQLGSVTLGATSLAPDAGTSGTLTHTVVEGDLPGPLTNTVTVTGTPPVGSDVSATADESVTLTSGAAITVTKTANVSAAEVGETITYTYRVTNTGNVTLNPVSAADDQLGSVTLGATSLAPDVGTSGTLTYTVVEGDLPGPLANTVTVTGTPPVGSDVSATADESVIVGDVVTPIDSTDGGSLDYTDPQAGITTTIDIPGGAVTETITLVYDELSSSTHPAPAGFDFAGRTFTLEVYLGAMLQPGYVFKVPVTLTLTYNPDDLGNVDEATLELRYWDGNQWSADGITVVERDTANHRLVVTIEHLTEFALFGEERRETPIYLPLVMKGFVYAPDLVVESLVATSSAVTVTIKNQGNVAVTDDFWVDVYFNPSETPSLNHPWNTIADHGAVWGVTTDIQASGVLTLTTGGDYYVPEYSSQPPLPVGADVYTLVDSVDYSTTYGAVQESNEGNNLFGPVTSTTATGQAAPVVDQGQPASREGLPSR